MVCPPEFTAFGGGRIRSSGGRGLRVPFSYILSRRTATFYDTTHYNTTTLTQTTRPQRLERLPILISCPRNSSDAFDHLSFRLNNNIIYSLSQFITTGGSRTQGESSRVCRCLQEQRRPLEGQQHYGSFEHL
jgi:hypothetical protein